jgi:hypothetical protein
MQSLARASLATERAAKELEEAALEWDRAALKFQVESVNIMRISLTRESGNIA